MTIAFTSSLGLRERRTGVLRVAVATVQLRLAVGVGGQVAADEVERKRRREGRAENGGI